LSVIQMRLLGLLGGLLATGVGAVAQAQTIDATVCDVVNHPMKFDGKVVRLKGLVQSDFDSFTMRADSCTGMLWLSYPAGTKAKSGPAVVVTMQLASNASGTTGTARPALTLERNKDFETFDLLLTQRPKTPGMCLACVKNDVMATLVGRIDGTENAGLVKDKTGKITSLDGFGNLNQYTTRMVIESVADVTAKELDYTKTPKVNEDSQGGNNKDFIGSTRKTETSFPKGSGSGEQIETAIAAYGSPGQDNGVEIAFGDVANVPAGEGTRAAKASTDGLQFTVRFDADKLKGDALSRAVAHQGAEVAMLREAGNKSAREIELKAWQTLLLVTIGARQKTLTLSGGTVLWTESWAEAERSPNAGKALVQYLDDRVETPR
jgi:hypothetical protein